MQPLHRHTWCPNTACLPQNTWLLAAQLLGKQLLQPPDVLLAQASQDPMISSHRDPASNPWIHIMTTTASSWLPRTGPSLQTPGSISHAQQRPSPRGLKHQTLQPACNRPGTKTLVNPHKGASHGPPAHRPSQSTRTTALPEFRLEAIPRTQGVPAKKQTPLNHRPLCTTVPAARHKSCRPYTTLSCCLPLLMTGWHQRCHTQGPRQLN